MSKLNMYHINNTKVSRLINDYNKITTREGELSFNKIYEYVIKESTGMYVENYPYIRYHLNIPRKMTKT